MFSFAHFIPLLCYRQQPLNIEELQPRHCKKLTSFGSNTLFRVTAATSNSVLFDCKLFTILPQTQ